jgi:hypothetical protein
MRVHRAGTDTSQSHREYFRFQMVDPDDGVPMKLVCLRWMGHFYPLLCSAEIPGRQSHERHDSGTSGTDFDVYQIEDVPRMLR